MSRLINIIIVVVMLLISACSVKEDRNGCPCWMTIDLSRVDSCFVRHDRSIVLRFCDNVDDATTNYDYQMAETVRADVGTLEYKVPRGLVGVSAVNPVRTAIPTGEQMDSLYGFFKCFHTRQESVKCDVELHKEFCTVSFTLGEDGYTSPYDIEVWGNIAGVSAWNLMPVQGDFRYAPVQKNGVYQVRVPRQEDNSLELVMLEMPNQVEHDGEKVVVDRLPLGEYIARSGYDWTAEDLADVNIALDLEMQQVMITVSGWDGVVVMDIVI